MPNNWTPTSPLTIGQPWMVSVNTPVTVRSGVDSPVQRLRSLAAETVAGLELGIFQPDGGSAPFIGLAEVFAAGNESPPAITSVAYQPNSDAAIGSWLGPGGDTTNLFEYIDDAVVAGGEPSTYLQTTSATSTAYRCTVDSAAFPLTRRVTNLKIQAVFAIENAGAIVSREFVARLHHVPTGDLYTPVGASYWANLYGTPIFECSLGEINPVTMLPWTPQDVRDFDIGGDWQIRVSALGSATCPARIYSLELRVGYTATENRLAVGTFERVPGFNSLSMIATSAFAAYPTGASTWSKPNAFDYSIMLRQAVDTLVNPGVTLADDIAWWTQGQDLGQFGSSGFPPVPQMALGFLPLVGGQVPTSGADFIFKRAGTVNVMLSGGGLSNDSQPYCQTLRSFGQVHSLSTVEQSITAPATDDYLGYRFLAAPPNSSDADLTVKVFGVVSGLQVGPTLTVDADDARARIVEGITARVAYLEGFFDGVIPLVAATQYEVRFESAGSSGDPWTIFGIGDGAINPNGDGATMGGATDKANIPGLTSGELDGIDLSFALSVAPDPPAFVTADMVSVELDVENGGSGSCAHCKIPSVEMVDITWAATTLGGAFSAYTVQRNEVDRPDVWETVATVDVEATTTFRDPTTRRSAEGIDTRYRVRAEVTDGSFTTWTESDWTATRTHSVEVVFASLTVPEATLAYHWDPEVTYQFLSAARDTIIPLYGSDRQVAFSEVENRGKAFPMALIANYWDAPPVGGSKLFEPLEELFRLPGPYIAVLNHNGERFYAHCQLTAGVDTEPHNRYVAEIQVTEVAVDPYPLAVS